MIDAAAPVPEDFNAAIIGAGAMGLSLAALLGERVPVSLVVRSPDRARELASRGATVHGLLRGSCQPRIVPSIAALAGGPCPTVIFVATKTNTLGTVAPELRSCLSNFEPAIEHSDRHPPFVVSFQNGIETGRDLMRELGYPNVLRMVLNYGATRDGPTSSRVVLNSPPHFIGGPDANHAPFARMLAGVLCRCGLRTHHVEQIEPYVWTKGVVNAATNPVAALTDSTVGEVLDSPARAILARLLDEGFAVARARGIALAPDIADRVWALLETARAHMPSMVADIRGGRPTEIGQLNRQIIEHARLAGVATPSHEVIAALIDAFDWRVFRRSDAPTISPSHMQEVPHAFRD